MYKKITLVSRILLGLIFIAASIAGLTGQMPPPEGGIAQVFMGLIFESGLLIFIKIVELIAGLALLAGVFVPLALLVLAPIIINIFYFHLSLDSMGIPVGIMLIILALVTASRYRQTYQHLLQMRDSA